MDPDFGIDRSTAALLEFPGGHASFFCSTRSSRYQQARQAAGRLEGVLILFFESVKYPD